MRHVHRLVLALLACVPTPAIAVNLDWINAAGGAAGNAANWNPAQVPTAADVLRFNLAGSYNVNFGVNAPASQSLQVGDGTVQLSFLVPHDTGLMTFGNLAGLTSDVRVADGTLRPNGGINVATGANTDATFEVSGSSTDVVMQSSATQLQIGTSGTSIGRVNVINGGALTVPGGLHVPGTSGQNGFLTVQGTGTSRRSTLTLESNVSTYYVKIGTSGTGTVNVQDGALFTMERDIRVGETAGESGTLALAGGDPADSARVFVDGDLLIARNEVAAAPGGTGTVSVGLESAMDVTGTTWTYDDDAGGLGTLEVKAGGRFATRDLRLGNPASELKLLGGTLQITGGVLDATGDPLRIGGASGNPMVQLLAGSTCELNSATIPALEVGTGGAAEFQVLGGSSLIVHDRLARLGANAGSAGAMLVSGASTLVTDDDLIVGRAGSGSLQIEGGSQATLGGLNLATQATGSGSGFITGAGTDVHVNGNLVLSGLVGGSSGATSSLTVTENARLWLDGALSAGAATVWAPGTLGLANAGELRMTDSTTLDVKGLLQLQGGLVTGGVVDLRGGGRLTGTGDVDAEVYDTLDTLAIVTATGPLSLGDATRRSGYVMRGRLNVGGNTVTLRDADSASVGAVSIAGGTLQGPAGGIHIESAGYLVGSGTVNGPLRNEGSVLPSSHLSFGGLLSSEGAVIRGDRITFLSGGGFRGRGTVEADVTLAAGSTAHLTGATTFDGVVTATGLLDLDGQTATFPSPGFAFVLGGELDLSGGTVVGNGSTAVLLLLNGRLTGTGIVVGPTTVSDGRIAPGPGFGTITTTSLSLASPVSTLELELGDRATGTCDRILVTGTADLGGTLDLRLAPTYDAVPGDSFLVVSAGSVSSSFFQVTLAGAPATGKASVRVNGGQVWVVIENGLADVPGGPEPPAAGTPSALAFAPLGSPGRAPAFELALPMASEVRVELFDVSGRRVARLASGALAAGRHRLAVPREAGEPGLLLARAEVRGAGGTRTLVAKAVRLR